MNDDLTNLLKRLERDQPKFSIWDSYYAGRQPLAFLAPESRTALGDRFGRIATNIPRLAITSLAERMRVAGFSDVDVWPAWMHNDMDQRQGLVHREALTLGRSYVLVWGDQSGRAVISAESARQVAAVTDPSTGAVTMAIKRWATATSTEAAVYYADRVERWTAPVVGATSGGFKLTSEVPNPLGAVPVVSFVNSDRLLDDGVSEIADLAPLVDALNKTVADMMVASEMTARPRRWATGIELIEDEDGEVRSPIPEGDRQMVSEDSDTRFGQLPGADLNGYRQAVDILLGQIMAVSALPSHYVGITSSNPASAEALRASEAALTARAEARAAQFGISWEAVADLAVAVENGGPVQDVAHVQWADPSTRSIAQQADAVTKLYQSGLLPASYALQRLGYSDAEVQAIRAARRAEALDEAAIDLSGTDL